MDNKQIYKKTLCFSVRRLLWDILAFLILGGLAVAGAFIAEKTSDKALIGLAIGAVIGLIVLIILVRWVSYKYKAGQIAMMTKGITEGTLPEDVLGEGNRIVKSRFRTVAAFFAVTSVIRGIFNQLGCGISEAGRAVGGDTGGTVGDVISSAIQTVIRYLCDCCLGWVFYRKDVKATKATCEGAVLFFKHGKTLAKNMGRVFGIGLASLAVIGGVFTGIFWLIASRFPEVFARVFTELQQTSSKIPAWLNSPEILMIVTSAIGGVIIWSILHSVFIRPFVLTGVLRNYIQSGMDDIPDEKAFSVLDGKSAKFKKLHQEAA